MTSAPSASSPPAATPGQQRRRAALRELAYLLVLLVVAALAYGVLVLLPSRLKTRRLERERDALEQRLASLRRGIERRQAETAALGEDPWAVERALRRQLDYLGSGEQVLTSSQRRQAAQRR